MPTREQLISSLHATLEAEPEVESAWLGGSLAFGRNDEHSDIDLSAVIAPDLAPALFARLEAALESLAPIQARFEVPWPPTADFSQRFYQLVGLPESLMIDVALLRPDRVEAWLDPVRHGHPVLLFDRGGRIVPTPDTTLGPVFADRLRTLRARAKMFGHIPAKNAARGHWMEAFDTFHRMLLAPLVELLRARYCPQRQDFGFRYLDLDLPPAVYARLCGLLAASSLDELAVQIAAARAWLEAELAERDG